MTDFQGVLDNNGAWSADSQQVPCRGRGTGGHFVEPLSQTPGPSYCCSCRRVDCVDLLRRTVSTSSDVSPDRVTSDEVPQSLLNGDVDRSVSLSQQQNSTRPAIPHPSSDVTVTPI